MLVKLAYFLDNGANKSFLETGEKHKKKEKECITVVVYNDKSLKKMGQRQSTLISAPPSNLNNYYLSLVTSPSYINYLILVPLIILEDLKLLGSCNTACLCKITR